MPTVREHAEHIIQLYIAHRKNGGDVFLTYGHLAQLMHRPGEHRLLGAPLDMVRRLCAERGLPDISCVVVSKSSLQSGNFEPTVKALEKHNGWSNLRSEQVRVREWKW